ncbi:hypothetical protein [Fibrobacter sp. UWP2]|uniref:hypothetical protein n=1 Tax=Fibrobacter sp. UWP2 TaxID=1896216 RepID=UPI00091AC0DA|nr:hypothetical protein [Fibrobacter sp. UWP2]SHI88648.1 hypothetical protein SAMN05720471_11027 [Fibrobacter sp. UWP2]
MDFSVLKKIGMGVILGAASAFAVVELDYTQYATFQAHSSPNVEGANRELPKNSIGSRLRGGALYGPSKRVSINPDNNGDWDDMEVDADYRFSYLPIYGSIDKFVKSDIFVYQISFGIYNGIYSGTSLGINTKYFELGVTSFQRFTYQNYDYLGYKVAEGKDENGDPLMDIEYKEKKDKLVLHVGVGGYASLFLGSISFNYNGSVYRPHKSITINETNMLFSFDMPILFTNHFGISYKYSDTMDFQIGVTNMLIDFNGGNWSVSAGISLWSF